MAAFSAPAALALVTQHRVSALIAVPAMLVDLLAAHDADSSGARQGFEPGSTLGCPSVRRLLLGGGEVPASLVWRTRLLFPSAVLTTAYGMTEACSSITFQPLGGVQQEWAPGGNVFSGSGSSNCPEGVCMGLPPPGIELAVLPLGGVGSGDSGACPGKGVAGTGRAADPDGVCRSGHGEVLTRGPHVMVRYWGDPSATSAAFVVPAAACGAACATHSAPALPAAASQAQRVRAILEDAGTSSSESSIQGLSSVTADTAGCPGRALDAELAVEVTSSVQGVCSTPGVTGRCSGGSAPPPGAWLRTGDLGTIDASGRLWLAGRLKDVVRSGGENVNAAEVERVLTRHPAVAAAAVVGLPHARLGEQVGALLVLRPGFDSSCEADPGDQHDTGASAHASGGLSAGPLVGTGPPRASWEQAAGAFHAPGARQTPGMNTSAEGPPGAAGVATALAPASLAAFCRAQGLAGFKVPRAVAVQKHPLPANSAGKVLKADVRTELLRRLAAPAVLHSRM